jgi:hypothetical protein
MKYVNSARFITVRPPRTFSRLMANAAVVATNSVMHAHRHRDDQRVAQLHPEVVEVEVLLLEHDAKLCSVGSLGHRWPEVAESLLEIANSNMW